MHPLTTPPDDSPADPAAGHAHTSTSVDDHAALIRELFALIPERDAESVPLADALGRVTAIAVDSPVDLPLFRNSQMDGFAVVAADLAPLVAAGSGSSSIRSVSLPIVGEVAARPGVPAPLVPGTAVRIMTGAVVPDGADAVVPVEDTSVVGSPEGSGSTSDAGAATGAGLGAEAALDSGAATALGSSHETVIITRARAVGEYVRERGSDVAAGTQLLPAGIRLAPRHLAVLAAAGLGTVSVRPRIRVAVITTGAELIAAGSVAPGEQPLLGQVYDANAIALTSAIAAAGAELTFAARVVDETADMLAALASAAQRADLIITSGGISKGEYEVVREALAPLGARVGHIAMQPGGPQTTAVFEGVPVISFPGNPVSTQISFEVFVAPILRAAAGIDAPPRVTRPLAHDLRSVPRKRQFLRGRIEQDGSVSLVSGPGSHLVAGLAASDVLVDVPVGTLEMNEGDLVETWQL